MLTSAFSSLIEMVQDRADALGDRVAYRFLSSGDIAGPRIEWSYAEVARRARAIAATLQDAGAIGQRVLLLYPPDIEFISGFLGCVFAGALAVPTYPPDPTRLDRTLPRLRAIARDCQASFVLTSTPVLAMAQAILPQAPELASLRWIASDRFADGADAAWRRPEIPRDGLAFLQYTSGSTGSPKGVMVSHANILHNEQLIAHAFGHDAGACGVGWLPMFHDMGLLGLVLQPLYVGFSVTLMSPLAFLSRPLRWLEAISQVRATSSGGPNFAYELCLRKITERERERLDLSSWEVAFNGAEPINPDTLDRFSDVFASCGFRRRAFYPCYGLAESTLIVTGGDKASPPVVAAFDAGELAGHRAVPVPDQPATASERAVTRLVSSGRALLDQSVAIVDPDTSRPCSPGQIGEIWVSGPSVARGYWNLADESTRTFTAFTAGARRGPFLRTGDLGFLHDGELFVTGRCKDLIIIRGRNLYPQDIEYTVERAHASLRTGGSACFSIESQGEERLVVVAEVDERKRVAGGGAPDGGDAGLDDIIAAIRRAVALAHEVAPYTVALIPPRSLPKTSSGKVQRRSCRDDFLHRRLSALATSTELARGDDSVAPGPELAPFSHERAAALRAEGRTPELRGQIEGALREIVAGVLGVAPAQLDRAQPILDHGLDSLRAMQLVNHVRDHFQLEVPLATAFERSIAGLAAWIDDASRDRGRDALPPLVPGQTTEPYPLSLHQQRVWRLECLRPGAALYNLTFSAGLRGPLDAARLRDSFHEIMQRHDVLRAYYRDIGGEMFQGIAQAASIELPVVDLRALAEPARDAERHRVEREIACHPFDLHRAPMVRGTLLRTGDDDHALVIGMHHSLCDGQSIAILLRELSALYDARARGVPSPLAPLALQFRDYAAWQRAWLTDEVLAPHLAYWTDRLRDAPVPLRIPRDPPAGAPPHGERFGQRLPPGVAAALKQVGQREGATLFMTAFAAFAVLLHRLTGQHDLAVGVPVSNRPRAELDALIGVFLNNVVLRVDVQRGAAFGEVLRQVRRVTLDAYEHRHVPYDKLLDALRPIRGDQPLYSVFFNMVDVPHDRLELGGITIDQISSPDAAAKLDMTLYLMDTSAGLSLEIVHDTAQFTRASIEHLLGQFCGLLTQIAERPNAKVADYSL